MADDPNIHWTLANDHGIWMKGNAEPWHADRGESHVNRWNSGRATDVLCRADGNLVVASANGGIWLVADGGTVCVSDRWEDSAFTALAQGPDDDQHVFAGGAGAALYMTDLSRLVPMLDWIRLDSLRSARPDVGTILDIVVLRQSRVIVIAATGGVFWSRIEAPPVKLGAPATDSFRWRRATIEGDLPGGLLSLAEGPALPGEQAHPSQDGPVVETIMGGGRGDPDAAGLFWGTWDKPDLLVFRRSRLFNQSVDVTLIAGMMSFSVVASTAFDRHIGYAACVAEFSDSVLVVFKTTDGGRTWNAVEPRVPGLDLKKTFADALGSTQKGHNLCIGVSNTNPDLVTIGCRVGAMSFDGGRHWRKPGFDPDQMTAVTDHLHADLTNYEFPRVRATEPIAPEVYYVSSDGGVAQVGWGDGAWAIESDRSEDGEHGNFYAVVLQGNSLVLHVRRSRSPLVWEVQSVISQRATGSGCLIQSDFQTGDSPNGNLEVIVPEDSDLVHYACAIQNGAYTNWSRRGVISRLSTGPGCIIQSDFKRAGSHGNFEVVALEGNELVHYWLDGANVTAPWNRGATISTQATGQGCLIQSHFGFPGFFGPTRHGNLEVIVLEGTDFVHYWHDSSNLSSPWSPRTVIHQADSAGCFFQSTYADAFGQGNFELIFRRGNALMFSFRNNSLAGGPWSPPIQITGAARKAAGPGCMFQGSYGGNSDHGNFELLVPEAGALAHHYRDNARSGLPWRQAPDVTSDAFTFRSHFNRKLATLQFFEPFGGSMIEDGALAGALQDNGTVNGVSGPNGTPWFRLEGGDGIAAFYLSGRSPRIPGKLAAGHTAVHQNNALDADPSQTKGSKSAHWQPGTRDLVLDNHGKGGSVIPLLLPKPGVVPVPNPESGLKGGSTTYALVRSPENIPKGMILAALAVQGTDLYVLLVGQDLVNPHPRDTLAMHWEFQHTFAGASGVSAIASADGLTAIVDLLEQPTGFGAASGPHLSRLDLSTGAITPMPVAAGAASGHATSIAIVSKDEAYAVINPDMPGASGAKILCWNGTQWIAKGQPPATIKEGLLSLVAVDPTQNPATVFASASNKVYISRDSAKTWTRASLGLPEAISCDALHWVRDSNSSHLYLATFGRSVWRISAKERW